MPSDVEELRELARAYWSGRPIPCPKHPGAVMTGSFVQTTFADHIFLTCQRGRESITIPQRPKQLEFQPQQVEGFVENLQRGDAIQCYRCQSAIEIATIESAATFTCVRCFSYGTWSGNLALAAVLK
jgi:hypothetical protein